MNVTRVRTGESPAQLLHDVPPSTARHFLARVATAHVATPGVVIVMGRDRLVIDSAAGLSTVYTISPALGLGVSTRG